MEEELKSEGKCIYCCEMFPQKGIVRHLAKHLSGLEKEKPSSYICTVHMYETDKCLFCTTCAKKHEKVCDDFEDYASMPVVNFPRMGVCGYGGGTIDVERDGAYKFNFIVS